VTSTPEGGADGSAEVRRPGPVAARVAARGGPLGPVVVLTDRLLAAAAGHELPGVVRAAAQGGAGTVIFREKDMTGAERLALGRAVADAMAGTATRLVVASDAGLARRLGAFGVHLAQQDDPVDGGDLVTGRSCHDRDEVAAALDQGAAYITVSPVFATASKPGYGPALGPAGAVALLPDEGDPSVAYGLGGIRTGNAIQCLEAGLSGVAVMGTVMTAVDPLRTVSELVGAVAPAVEASR
jgi:thiamine-phosphate pyrophosphorylase